MALAVSGLKEGLVKCDTNWKRETQIHTTQKHSVRKRIDFNIRGKVK